LSQTAKLAILRVFRDVRLGGLSPAPPRRISFVPTYAYRCTTCEHRFDAVQRMADDPLTDCPTCGGFVRRMIQNVPVVFKGSGWYVNDSRKSAKSESASAAPDSSTSGDGAKPSETAKSAKTEPKAAPAAAAAAD
jgi:putative FmdB family regulatory protein